MPSDIKLEGQQVRVEAWDLVIDAADRRKQPEGDRRALVHNAQDGLTLNWDHDYPGGVTLNGVRVITKDPNFIANVTVTGGLTVTDGNLHLPKGNKLILSDPNVMDDDHATGEIHQTDNGLHISGDRPSRGSQPKPVNIDRPVAKKTITWGEWSPETVNRVGGRARPGNGSADTGRSATSTATTATLLAGSALANSTTHRVALSGALPLEFDVVDTFIQLLDELSELRERVAALEAALNG